MGRKEDRQSPFPDADAADADREDHRQGNQRDGGEPERDREVGPDRPADGIDHQRRPHLYQQAPGDRRGDQPRTPLVGEETGDDSLHAGVRREEPRDPIETADDEGRRQEHRCQQHAANEERGEERERRLIADQRRGGDDPECRESGESVGEDRATGEHAAARRRCHAVRLDDVSADRRRQAETEKLPLEVPADEHRQRFLEPDRPGQRCPANRGQALHAQAES